MTGVQLDVFLTGNKSLLVHVWCKLEEFFPVIKKSHITALGCFSR